MQFRLGSHDLPIEQGRMARPIVPRYLRRCTLCSRHAPGDERHFMLECPQFDDIHAQYPDLLQDAHDSMRNLRRRRRSLRLYSQQRLMRTSLSCCLGLIGNGQYKSTNRLLVVVPHVRPHGIMKILKNLCMLLPKALKMRAIKDTMALVADSIGGIRGAPAQMSWHLRHLKPALLNWQGMSTHPKMENGSELCHQKGQLIIGLCVDPVRPCKPPQLGAKLGTLIGTLRGSTTWRNVKAPPHRHVSGQHGLAKSKVINIANTAT